MAEQLIFSWPTTEALGPEDFFVSDANRDAVAMVSKPETWPEHKLVLVGAQGSGKSHLSRIFEAQTGGLRLSAYDLPVGLTPDCAVVIEDLDRLPRAAEEPLFHLHNALRSAKLPLLMTARTAPGRWAIELPDLASRMQASTPIHIAPPDDTLLEVLMTKLFSDRQVIPAPNVLQYLVRHMERSYSVAQKVVTDLDALAMQRKGPITIKLAAEVLDKHRGSG